jgi:asparagine N-glycosylation enzyme membrane subunit Stt3
MLVPGVMAGMAWMTGPVFGAIAVVAFWRMVRKTEVSPAIALGAASLLAVAPFMVFMAGSHMNHVPTLAWLCLALVGLRATTGDEPSVWIALHRVLPGHDDLDPADDGVAFALPAGLAAGSHRATTH